MNTYPAHFFVKIWLAVLLFSAGCEKEKTAPTPIAPDLSGIDQKLAEIEGFTQKSDWDKAWPLANTLAGGLLAHQKIPQDSLIGQLNGYFYEIGDAFFQEKKFDQSIQVFELGLKLTEKRPDLFPIEIGANQMHLAVELHGLGQGREAIQLAHSATGSLEGLHSPVADSLLGWNFNKIGSFYIDQGDYREAIRFYEKSLAITSGLKNWATMRSYALCDLAICHAGLGDLNRANHFLGEGIKAVKRAKPKFAQYYQSSLTDQFGSLLLGAGRAGDALGLFEKQQKEWKKKPNEVTKSDWASLFGNIGKAHLALRDFDRSGAALDQSLRYLGDIFPGKNPEKAQVLMQKAQVLTEKGDLASAISVIEEAISQFDGAGDGQFSGQLFEIFAKKSVLESRLFEEKKDRPELLKNAIGSAEKAVQMLDDLRGNFADARSKTELMAQAGPFIESAIGAADALARLENSPVWWEKAFFFAEKSKSVQLLAAARETQAQELAGVPEKTRQSDRNLKLKIAGWQNALEQAQAMGMDETNPDFRAVRDSVFSLKNEQRKHLVGIEKAFPNFFKNKMDVRVASASAVKKALAGQKNTALVEWFWGDKTAYCFKIDAQNGIFCAKTPIDSSLSEAINSVLANIGAPPDAGSELAEAIGHFSDRSFLLFEHLLRPVFADGKFPRKLVAVPDGILGRLPLEVLLTKNAPAASWRTLPYFLHETEVGYAFSATLFLEKNLASRAAGSLAAFAPDYSGTRLLAMRDRGEKPKMAIFPGLRGGFQMLINNQPEAEKVAEIEKGKAFLGKNASETAFKKVAGQFRSLHFAMHALANDSLPELSQLVFSETGDGENDGRLYAWELCGLPLNADLVVLSACETGAGRVQRGEGVQSLARAFRQAGCPNLVMSLWQADDAVTGKIMERFYEKRATKTDQAAALASAKRWFLTETEDNGLIHPFFWATFVRVGAIEEHQSNRYWQLVFLCISLLFLSFFWLKNRKQNSSIR